MNKILKFEIWKAAKHGLDAWPDILRFAQEATPMSKIEIADLERMKSDVWIDQFADAFVAAADRHFQVKNARRDERAVLR